MEKQFTFTLKGNAINKIMNGKELIDQLENQPFQVSFDYDKSRIVINDKQFKIVNNWDYTYKVQKTQIGAKYGVEGLNKFLFKASNPDDVFHGIAYGLLMNIYNKVKPCKA